MARAKPTPAEIAAHRDDGYRALGRNIAVFSEMVVVMRDTIVNRLTRPDTPSAIAQLAFAQTPAANIADIFFAACWQLLDHDSSEEKTANKLGEEIHQVIRQRNDFAHGDWYIGALTVPNLSSDAPITLADPFAHRIDPRQKKQPHKTIRRDLDAESDNIDRLADLLRDYGDACFGAHANGAVRVSDVIRLQNKIVVPGPKAVCALPSQIPVARV